MAGPISASKEMTRSQGAQMFPRIQVSGDSYQCGKSYGEQARKQILISIERYRSVFLFYAKWNWQEVVEYAREFREPINDFDPNILSELQGIADGAGVDFLDILAINTRTEIMFAAKTRDITLKLLEVLECSSFAVTSNLQGILIGENWDWLTHCKDTVVILEAAPIDAPKYITIVEAGLLAKFGMNSQGFGVATNALMSSLDRGLPGVPYHVLLRALLKESNTIDGITLINKAYRSSSANYLLADIHGMSVDVEAMTGDWKNVAYLLADSDHVLVHTNHFLTSRFEEFDVTPGWIPSTLFRHQKLLDAVANAGDPSRTKFWKEVLCGHLNLPNGVCSHEIPEDRAEERFSTITSAIMNLNAKTIEITCGRPCENEYIKLDYSVFFR